MRTVKAVFAILTLTLLVVSCTKDSIAEEEVLIDSIEKEEITEEDVM